MSDNASAFLPAVEELARESGAILMRHFRKLKTYEKKGAIDLQTIADRESESYLTHEIMRRLPAHSVIAEEDGRVLNPGSDYLWIIDPLDGTTNFAHGLRLFAVSIALTHRGAVIAGAVYAPALDEMYLAARGAGATLNGATIRVSETSEIIDALLVTGFPYNRVDHMDEIVGMHRACLEESRGVLRLGAAALDFAAVAAGFIDAFYEFGLKPWDMAAGALLVEEAGGKIGGLLDGEPLDLFKPRCIASNGAIHSEVLRLLMRGGAESLPR
ncbi:inositol monophosphatase family protein [soil metagenome]